MPNTREEIVYWGDRQKKFNDALAADETRLKERLSREYTKEYKRLEKEIGAYYSQYGKDNVLEYKTMLEKMDAADYALLMQREKDFFKQNPNLAHLQPVRESIYQLTRLEGLQESVYLQSLEVGALEEKEIGAHLLREAERMYGTAREALGNSTAFNASDRYVMENLVGRRWADGKNYSQRIWDNRIRLSNILNQDIAQGFARGDTFDSMRKILEKHFVDKNRAYSYRLLFTEGSRIANDAAREAFKDDFELYIIQTAGDARVCEICQSIAASLEANPQRWADAKDGENFPPFHPWCRCEAIPFVEDWQKWIDDYVAKHGGDPEDAADIARQFAETQDEAEQENARDNDYTGDYDSYIAKAIGRGYYDEYVKSVQDCPNETARNVWRNYEGSIEVENHTGGRGGNRAYCQVTAPRIVWNAAHDMKGDAVHSRHQELFHEGGHAIDAAAIDREAARQGVKSLRSAADGTLHFSKLYKRGIFPYTLQAETKALVDAKDKELKALAKAGDIAGIIKANGIGGGWEKFYLDHPEHFKYKKSIAYDAIERDIRDKYEMLQYTDVSDMLEGATRGKIQCGVGHGARYWSGQWYYDTLATEAFAEMYSATLLNNESLPTIKEIFPKSYEVFEKMLKEIEGLQP